MLEIPARGERMNIDSLTHASICLDEALAEALKGNPEKAREFIRKAKESLEWFE